MSSIKTLTKIEKLFRIIQEELGEQTQAQTVRFLLNIAKNKGPTDHTDLANIIGVSKASISRNTEVYGPSPSSRGEKLKKSLIKVDYHPEDRRRLVSVLNSDGEKFIKKLIDVMED